MEFIAEHTGLMIGLIAAAVAVIVGIIVSGYVKAPPDKAYIISGIKKSPRGDQASLPRKEGHAGLEADQHRHQNERLRADA